MNTAGRSGALLVLATAAVLAFPAPAAAYVGPGAALAVIGAAIAVIGAVFVTIGGFVWYPFKRLWKAIGRGKGETPADDE
jgi:uncharacterized membrane protein